MAQGDAVIVHVHRRHVPLTVGFDLGLLCRPGLAVILAAVNGQRRWRMVFFDECQDVAAVLIDGDPAAHESLGDANRITPSRATVFAAPYAYPVLREHC